MAAAALICKRWLASLVLINIIDVSELAASIGEEEVISHRGKKSHTLLTHLLSPNSQVDVIILNNLLGGSSEEKFKLLSC